jgi:hypothetical protein
MLEYKNQLKDSIGNFRTLSLFYETNITDLSPIFTLKDEDHTVNGKTYMSMKQLYLSFDDPTEWEFVQSVLGNWRHWQKIMGNKRLREYIDQWRMELEIKLRSQAVRNMVKHSKNRDGAAKWLAEGSWKGKRGRPSKDEVERERKVQAGIEQDLDEHWARLVETEGAPSKAN